MDSYDEISKEELISELKKIEEENNTVKQDNNHDDDVLPDVFRSYIKQISKYPLLTVEEEIKYGKDLKRIENLYVVDKEVQEGICHYSLNEEKVINYLTNSRISEIVLDVLVTELSRIGNKNDVKIIELLKKYRGLSKAFGRKLNYKDLELYFNIDKDKVNVYSDLEFIVEIRNFILYREAYSKMFHSNLPLVVSIAKKRLNGNDMMELISEGNIGLMRAIDMYDVDLGFRFSTYATWWIYRTMKASARNSGLIRFPSHYITIAMRINREASALKEELGREPTDREIAAALDMPLDDIKKYRSCKYRYVSLNQPVSENVEMNFEEVIEDSNHVEDGLVQRTLTMEIQQLLDEMLENNEITAQEKRVVEMIYGLGEYKDDPKKLVEISKLEDTPISRVRSAHSNCIRKIRRKVIRDSRLAALRDYLN